MYATKIVAILTLIIVDIIVARSIFIPNEEDYLKIDE